jgi:pimeloyl-ACP methyl ester carboxylesterase
MHGDQDRSVPYLMGRELLAAAPEPKRFWIVPGAGHNNLVQVARPAYAERIRSLYATLN